MWALVVDLNNFSRYPTLSVGYLVAILRGSDVEVDVLSPFSRGFGFKDCRNDGVFDMLAVKAL